jgi:hypothetical protein
MDCTNLETQITGSTTLWTFGVGTGWALNKRRMNEAIAGREAGTKTGRLFSSFHIFEAKPNYMVSLGSPPFLNNDNPSSAIQHITGYEIDLHAFAHRCIAQNIRTFHTHRLSQ